MPAKSDLIIKRCKNILVIILSHTYLPTKPVVTNVQIKEYKLKYLQEH